MGAAVRRRTWTPAPAAVAGAAHDARCRLPDRARPVHAEPVLGLPAGPGPRCRPRRGPSPARPPAHPALPLRARPRPAGLGRPGAAPDRLRPRRDLPRPVAHPPHRLRRHPRRHALRARGDRRGPGGLPGAARHGRACRGHRPVGGRGGPRRVPRVALPGVRDRRCGDRRDGGGGDPEGQPRGQGTPGRHRGRTRPVRGLGDASPAHGGAGRGGVGLASDQVLDAAAGAAQRRSWR